MTNAISKFLAPKEKAFFPLFESATANLLEVSKTLRLLVSETNADQRLVLTKRIEEMEHVGDSITHEIYNALSSTFITPFDREDIHELTAAIDDVVDFIHGSAKRLMLYKMCDINNDFIDLAELIEKGAIQLNIAIKELGNKKTREKIREACIQINSIENQADVIFDHAVANLFDHEPDAIKIIKVKEVLSTLETATDKCEAAANVINSILVKYA